jgi:hypothetical protein
MKRTYDSFLRYSCYMPHMGYAGTALLKTFIKHTSRGETDHALL